MTKDPPAQAFADRSISTPLVLLVVCVLAYGLYLPWMGFYWDDWPWIWRYHMFGPQAIREIDAAFRPLAGLVLWLGAQLAGESKLGWQLYNFVIRWLGSVTVWWALRQIWPQRKEIATWVAVLFVVYPGFTQQFVSINSSRHLFPLITFFLSLGWMGRAVHEKNWRLTGLAVGFSLITMFTTEYYYGLEIARGVFLWTLFDTKAGNSRHKLATTLKAWLPYLVPWGGILIWRFGISQHVNYEVSLVDQILTSPLPTIWGVISTALSDFIEVSLGAWRKLFAFPNPQVFGPKKTMLFWGLVGVSTAAAFIYAQHSFPKSQDRKWNWDALLIGAGMLLVSGLPFWATNLEIKLAFPNDRLTLPMMLGVSLVAVGLIDLLPRQYLRSVVMALTVGLSVGVHFQNAASYQRDWDYQAAFFEQLIWRVPGLAAGTAILSPELPLNYATDNSLTAPLNWVYGPDSLAAQQTVGLFYLDLRLGTKISALETEAPILSPGGSQPFESSTTQAIVIYHAPPACLRVLHPEYDRHMPGIPDEVDEAVPFSNLNQILPAADPPASLPEHLYGSTPTGSWCYYFELADLARQQKDWETIAALGDIAFSLGDSPNHAAERVPFIEAYAHTENWDTALALSLEAIKIDKRMGLMLCDTWERIERDTAGTAQKAVALQLVSDHLTCE